MTSARKMSLIIPMFWSCAKRRQQLAEVALQCKKEKRLPAEKGCIKIMPDGDHGLFGHRFAVLFRLEGDNCVLGKSGLRSLEVVNGLAHGAAMRDVAEVKGNGELACDERGCCIRRSERRFFSATERALNPLTHLPLRTMAPRIMT